MYKKDECKISALGTREMRNLKEKVTKKKISKGMQTDFEEENKLVDSINSLSILDKLPSMKKKTHEKNESIIGRRFLNVTTARGQKDRCFNCFDLEHKINDLKKKNTLMKKQISEYQESLGSAACVETRKGTEEKLNTGTSGPSCNETEPQQEDKKDKSMGAEVHEQNGGRGMITQSGDGNIMDKQSEDGKKMEEQLRNGEILEEKDGERQDTAEAESSEQNGAGARRGDETDMCWDDNIEDYFRERDCMEEYFKQRDQKRKQRLEEQKDQSPLCNEYVWSGKCWRRGCSFTHKKLCRNLERDGVCADATCRDGHNTKSICRYFNDRGCRYSAERCRYLHIKINNSEEKWGGKSQQNHQRKEYAKAEGENESSDGEEIRTTKEESSNEDENECLVVSDGDEMCYEETEITGSNAVEALDVQADLMCVSDSADMCHEETEITGSNAEEALDVQTNLMCVDEWYNEESGEEDESGEQEETAKCTEVETKHRADLTDVKERRDLLDFLRMDIKHDVWKEIKATKAEIRILEEEVKEKRRPGDRSQ